MPRRSESVASEMAPTMGGLITVPRAWHSSRAMPDARDRRCTGIEVTITVCSGAWCVMKHHHPTSTTMKARSALLWMFTASKMQKPLGIMNSAGTPNHAFGHLDLNAWTIVLPDRAPPIPPRPAVIPSISPARWTPTPENVRTRSVSYQSVIAPTVKLHRIRASRPTNQCGTVRISQKSLKKALTEFNSLVPTAFSSDGAVSLIPRTGSLSPRIRKATTTPGIPQPRNAILHVDATASQEPKIYPIAPPRGAHTMKIVKALLRSRAG
mmetsp:Transcript_25642/g.74129  ORF Transcript_25642/g.74129 Transcript_25642/m.74129 type:complete len:267 (-) Transcript_25642:483-1283(-)